MGVVLSFGDQMSGTVVAGKYRLIEALDAGSMGAVYSAEKLGSGERVAVKMLLPEFHGAPDIIARFLDEALAAQRLVHPNIVQVFDYGTSEDGTPFIVMELLEGVPVSAYLRDGAHIPLGHASHIIEGLLAGLGLAHSRGVIHRDLKPANVFLARGPDKKFVVKILDFGIAKVMDMAGGLGSRTKTGIFLGTPAYMSPEQIVKPKTVDMRSDLWSVGVMMYKMVTGRPPFGGVAEVDRLTAILHETPEPVERIDPQLEPIKHFMVRALAKDPAARFQSAGEMAAALTVCGAVARPFGGTTAAASRTDPRYGLNPGPSGDPQAAAALARSSGAHPQIVATALAPTQAGAVPAEQAASSFKTFLVTFVVVLLLAGAAAMAWMRHSGRM